MDSISHGLGWIGNEPESAGADASQRRRTRDSLFLMARLRIGDDPAVHEVRVRNLSESGMMLEFDGRVTADMPVALELRGIGDIRGRVAWCTEGRLGIALDSLIDPKKARKPVGGGGSTPLYAKPALW